MYRNRERNVIYIAFVVALLPAVLLRDFTPSNEMRYLCIADEALRNHALFAFTWRGEPYADKPPLYLWMVMLCRWLTGGHHMWLLSLLSLLPALGIVSIMDQWAKEEMSASCRRMARLMTLTTGLFLVCAVTIRMDMLMCLFIVLALREAWRLSTADGRTAARSGRGRWLLLPLYLFLAVFSKGPLGLLIPLVGTTTYICLRDRRSKDSRANRRMFLRVWGWRTWGPLLLLFGLWLTAVYAEGGRDYLYDLTIHQTVGRAVNAFHHNNPFYYYALCIWYCLFPWSLLVAGVLAAAWRGQVVMTDLQRFFLIVGTTTLVLLSCISGKLQIYMLPTVPFLTYAAAMSLSQLQASRWVKVSLTVPSAIFVLSLPALRVVSVSGLLDFPVNGMFYASAATLTLTGLRALHLIFRKDASPSTVIQQMGTGFLVAVFVAGLGLPAINAYISR